MRITTEEYRREAVGFEGRAAHGSGVGAEIRGWRRPGVIEAGWKMSGILLFKQNTATFGTPEKSSSLRLKTLFREQNRIFTHRGPLEDRFREKIAISTHRGPLKTLSREQIGLFTHR